VRYQTFDDVGEEVLRLSFAPTKVSAEGRRLDETSRGAGFTFDPKTGILRVRREGSRAVIVVR
jgi:hypothetical protein